MKVYSVQLVARTISAGYSVTIAYSEYISYTGSQ